MVTEINHNLIESVYVSFLYLQVTLYLDPLYANPILFNSLPAFFLRADRLPFIYDVW